MDTSETHRGDAARVMDALRRSVRALRSANAGATREFGVSAAQLFVMREVFDAPGLSLAQLAARTHTAQSTVSEVVSRLVAHGLVARTTSLEDRRRVVLHLTERGAAMAQASTECVQERMIEALRCMPTADRGRFADLFEGWLRASGIDAEPPTMFFEAGGWREGTTGTRTVTARRNAPRRFRGRD